LHRQPKCGWVAVWMVLYARAVSKAVGPPKKIQMGPFNIIFNIT